MDRLPNACDQRVSVLPTDDYVAVSPYTPLSQAIEAMKDDEGGCVIVSDDGRVAGIFTERDLLTKIMGEDVNIEDAAGGRDTFVRGNNRRRSAADE